MNEHEKDDNDNDENDKEDDSEEKQRMGKQSVDLCSYFMTLATEVLTILSTYRVHCFQNNMFSLVISSLLLCISLICAHILAFFS